MRLSTYFQTQRQANFVNTQFAAMSKVQQQISTGYKYQHASEAPVDMSQANNLQNYMDKLEGYNKNIGVASARASLIHDQVSNSIDIVTQIKTTLSQAINGTTGQANLSDFAAQFTGALSNLLSLASTHDPVTGGYIFSGFRTQTEPFALVNGSYVYQGGMESSAMNIGEDISTIYDESGYCVFENIFNGNGTFTVDAGASNTGGAITDGGSVNTGLYVEDTYTITFLPPSAPGLPPRYQVVGASGGQVIPEPPATVPNDAPVYQSGTPITFNGVTLTVSDALNPPHEGDTFTVSPAIKQNVFNTLQNLITSLKDPSSNLANIKQILTQSVSTMSQVSNHLISYRSEVDNRKAFVDSQTSLNTQTLISQKLELKDLIETDYPSAVSELSQKQMAMQASADSYRKFMETLTNILKL